MRRARLGGVLSWTVAMYSYSTVRLIGGLFQPYVANAATGLDQAVVGYPPSMISELSDVLESLILKHGGGEGTEEVKAVTLAASKAALELVATMLGGYSIGRPFASSKSMYAALPTLVDVFLTEDNTTVAVLNADPVRKTIVPKNKPKWAGYPDEYYKGWNWTCTNPLELGLQRAGVIEKAETHGHVAIINFGRGFTSGDWVRVEAIESGGKKHDYGYARVHSSPLEAQLKGRMQYFLAATLIFNHDTLAHKADPLKRWLDWHHPRGVEHVLVYVNDRRAIESVSMHAPCSWKASCPCEPASPRATY